MSWWHSYHALSCSLCFSYQMNSCMDWAVCCQASSTLVRPVPPRICSRTTCLSAKSATWSQSTSCCEVCPYWSPPGAMRYWWTSGQTLLTVDFSAVALPVSSPWRVTLLCRITSPKDRTHQASVLTRLLNRRLELSVDEKPTDVRNAIWRLLRGTLSTNTNRSTVPRGIRVKSASGKFAPALASASTWEYTPTTSFNASSVRRRSSGRPRWHATNTSTSVSTHARAKCAGSAAALRRISPCIWGCTPVTVRINVMCATRPLVRTVPSSVTKELTRMKDRLFVTSADDHSVSSSD